MVSEPAVGARLLLDRADAERAAGRGAAAAALYDEAGRACRAADDLAGWTRAVLGSASVYVFGVEPGKLPALLYDVLARTVEDEPRARLAAALARCWAYAGQPVRAVPFADEALERAENVGDPELVADCLDAALAVHWGPDELDLRRELTARLDDIAAHVLEPEARLQAHLWGLQVASEGLDIQAMHRHMRALELLGEESTRALFFAASRRLMLDLLRGRTDTAGHLIDLASDAAEQTGLADAFMVLKAMRAYSAVQIGDGATSAALAAEGEAFALAEGTSVVLAEVAYIWAEAGDLDRARALVGTFRGPTLDALPRDVNWLLVLQCLLEAALAVGDDEVVDSAARLLTPYEGRAVFNGGAVMFHGVTDDTLARAAARQGHVEEAARLRARALATYQRIGAQWWRDRLLAALPEPGHPTPAGPDPAAGVGEVHLHATAGGLWLIGRDGAAVPVAALRGFGYLRALLRRPGQPVSVLDLVGAGAAVLDQGGLGEPADRQALQAYRQRLHEIDAELDQAEEWADAGRRELLQVEREALLGEVARATGLHGRLRTEAGSSHERARVSVRKAIRTAIDRVRGIDPQLARHLDDHISTGTSCTYDPPEADPVVWVLD